MGGMKDKYVCRLEIKSTKKVKDLPVADKVSVQLMLTEPTRITANRSSKTSEKPGLYLAMDIADAWLTRALAK